MDWNCPYVIGPIKSIFAGHGILVIRQFRTIDLNSALGILFNWENHTSLLIWKVIRCIQREIGKPKALSELSKMLLNKANDPYIAALNYFSTQLKYGNTSTEQLTRGRREAECQVFQNIIYTKEIRRCLWRNGYRCRKWTLLPEFKFRTELFHESYIIPILTQSYK